MSTDATRREEPTGTAAPRRPMPHSAGPHSTGPHSAGPDDDRPDSDTPDVERRVDERVVQAWRGEGDPAREETPASAPAPAPAPTVAAKERKSRSGWLAAGLALALVAWMGSGLVWPAKPEPEPARATPAERAPVAVEAIVSKAREVTDYLVSDGQAVPDRVTVLRAEAGGNVEKVAVAKGDRVEKGQVLATIEAADRDASRATAEAELARARRDFEAVKSLADRGYATRQRVDQARVAVTAAEAQVAQATRGLSDTTITAPFAGVLDGFDLEAGQVVTAGAEIGTLVDSDPLKIEIKVPQQAVRSIRPGKEAAITFITGEKRRGTVTYVSSNANPATRTFTAEVEVENTDGIPSGISAQVRIPTSEAKAHFVSPATLSLGADGTLGVKTVEEGGIVGFHPVEVVRAETKGVWVSGLPEQVSIITVGQGFVDKGETVTASVREPEVGTANAPPDAPPDAPSPPAPSPPAAPAPQVGNAAPAAAAPSAAAPPADVTTKIVPIAPSAPATGPETDPTTAPATAPTAEPAEKDVATVRPPETPDTADPPFDTGRQIEDMQAATRQVQQRLNALGYAVGPADGIPGERTVGAIRKFQRDLALDPDGTITFDLLDALSKALAERS